MRIQMKRLPWHGGGTRGLMLVPLAVLLLAGCGRHRAESTSAATAQAPVEESMAQPAALVVPGTPANEERGEEVDPASLSPDIVATATDTLVVPGGTFDVEARTSPDAISVVLADGSGDRQKLTYDSSSDVWRTSYRAPLRPRGERVELSVTAKNGSQRWRRVWVFVPIEKPAAVAPTDSSSTP